VKLRVFRTELSPKEIESLVARLDAKPQLRAFYASPLRKLGEPPRVYGTLLGAQLTLFSTGVNPQHRGRLFSGVVQSGESCSYIKGSFHQDWKAWHIILLALMVSPLAFGIFLALPGALRGDTTSLKALLLLGPFALAWGLLAWFGRWAQRAPDGRVLDYLKQTLSAEEVTV